MTPRHTPAHVLGPLALLALAACAARPPRVARVWPASSDVIAYPVAGGASTVFAGLADYLWEKQKISRRCTDLEEELVPAQCLSTLQDYAVEVDTKALQGKLEQRAVASVRDAQGVAQPVSYGLSLRVGKDRIEIFEVFFDAQERPISDPASLQDLRDQVDTREYREDVVRAIRQRMRDRRVFDTEVGPALRAEEARRGAGGQVAPCQPGLRFGDALQQVGKRFRVLGGQRVEPDDIVNLRVSQARWGAPELDLIFKHDRLTGVTFDVSSDRGKAEKELARLERTYGPPAEVKRGSSVYGGNVVLGPPLTNVETTGRTWVLKDWARIAVSSEDLFRSDAYVGTELRWFVEHSWLARELDEAAAREQRRHRLAADAIFAARAAEAGDAGTGSVDETCGTGLRWGVSLEQVRGSLPNDEHGDVEAVWDRAVFLTPERTYRLLQNRLVEVELRSEEGADARRDVTVAELTRRLGEPTVRRGDRHRLRSNAMWRRAALYEWKAGPGQSVRVEEYVLEEPLDGRPPHRSWSVSCHADALKLALEQASWGSSSTP